MGEYEIDLYIPGVKRAELLDAIRSLVADVACEPAEGDDCCSVALTMVRFTFEKAVEEGDEVETVIEVKLEKPPAPKAKTATDRAGNKVVENRGVK